MFMVVCSCSAIAGKKLSEKLLSIDGFRHVTNGELGFRGSLKSVFNYCIK